MLRKIDIFPGTPIKNQALMYLWVKDELPSKVSKTSVLLCSITLSPVLKIRYETMFNEEANVSLISYKMTAIPNCQKQTPKY